jgi:adenosylmethionine-8-amino-7-oxononanoate aminotransferase
VLLAPAFIVQQAHLDEIVDKLGRTVDSVLAEVGA